MFWGDLPRSVLELPRRVRQDRLELAAVDESRELFADGDDSIGFAFHDCPFLESQSTPCELCFERANNDRLHTRTLSNAELLKLGPSAPWQPKARLNDFFAGRARGTFPRAGRWS